MSVDDRVFQLFSADIGKLVNFWLQANPSNQKKIDALFLDILKEQASESYERTKVLKKGTKEYVVAEALAVSSDFISEVIENRLEESVNEYLECQRLNPDKSHRNISNELIYKFKLLALDCFVSGIAAGNYNILPFEGDIVRANKAAQICWENNSNRSARANEISKAWRVKAEEIKNRWLREGLLEKLKRKSELISQVIKELDLELKYSDIKPASLQAKVRRHLFPKK